MKKLITAILFAVIVLALVFGLRRTVPYDSTDYSAELLPAGVTVGDVRVQLLGDGLVRLECEGERGFENRPSFTVQKRTGWEKVDYTEKTENGYTAIETANYTVLVPENATSLTGCRIEDASGNELWSYEANTNSNVFLPSPSEELKSWCFTDTPRVIPAENGYTRTAKNLKLNGWDVTNDAVDMFVFLMGGDYTAFMSDFTELTGQSEMLTLSLLGYWDSRYHEYTQESALQQIADYRERGYPLDALVIDTDWRKANSGAGYSINTDLFPDMEGFFDKAHEAGLTVIFNDHPEPAKLSRNLLDIREINKRTDNLTRLLDMGLDYWWYDRNWWTSLKPVEEGLSIYTSGMYAYHWITEQYYNSLVSDGEYAIRPLIMANVDGIDNGSLSYAPELASHRYSLQWTGDVGTSSADLKDEVFNAVCGGVEMGLPYVSADLGGHNAEVTKDMYVRWLQYGALSPICRVHCTKPYSRMPWLYGETAEAVAHSYVDLRYRLLPLYYYLAHENYETGLPLVRRLDISYPQYAEADAHDEYLLGDYLLVAPISESFNETDDYSFTSDGQSGLKGEFFENDELKGTPAVTTRDERVYFDWVFEAPEGLSISDYFSVRWSGEITVGAQPLFLRAFSDDGVRIYIDDELVVDGWDTYDTYFSTDFLEAGSTHKIKIEYRDGNNHAHIFITAYSEGKVSRDVFIPDGCWMDVWSGECYTGPRTISVSHGLETSPIFVRMGSVIPMADKTLNTKESDWSHLTLEVFPSADEAASAVVYEDDTRTVAYKSGEYRETVIELKGSEKQTLTVFPATGDFDSELCFDERSYTVRMHGRDGWGAVTGVTLNGESIDFKTIAKDTSAQPLAAEGGARDNTVYSVEFSAPVNEKSVLEFTFESVNKDTANTEYNATETEFSVSVNKLDKATADFTVPDNCKDWVLFGVNTQRKPVRMSGGANSIGEISCFGSAGFFNDNYSITWKNGEEEPTGTTACGLISSHSFTTTLNAQKGANEFKLYLGGYMSLAKLTVRDRAGNVRTVSFGDLQTNYYREVIITAPDAGELEVTYSIVCGTNITAAACTHTMN